MGRGALLPISIYVKEVNPMPRLEQTIDAVFSDRDITPSDVPQLDLYMDQVLTLFDRTLSESKRTPEDKLLTKTMVNNYVKEGLITPVRGKKYTRDQIMQLLCVYHLKQTLRLSDVKALTGRADVDFESCYASLLEEKERMRKYIPELLRSKVTGDVSDPNGRLRLCLALSEIANYLRRLCESMVDAIPPEEKVE